MRSVIFRIWLHVSNRNSLSLLDIIKPGFYGYGYGYSIYSIKKGGLQKEYDFLLKKNLVELHHNPYTDKKTSIYPTDLGLRVGKTCEEKQKWQKIVTKTIWRIVPGVAVAVISGLILYFGFGVGV